MILKVVILLTFICFSIFAQTATSVRNIPAKAHRSLLSDFSIQYYVNFAGPKLSNLGSANTYSKWKSGKDMYNKSQDPNDSINAYNSVSLRYQVSNNINLSYSYIFQNYFNTRSEYKYNGKDFGNCIKQDSNPVLCKLDSNGKFIYPDKQFTGRRDASQDNFDQSITMFYSNIVDAKYLRISSGFSYVHPTTESSKNNEMIYSFIVAPDINIKNSNYSINHGFLLNAQRYFYDDNSNKQTFTLAIAPYFNYSLNNNLVLTSQLVFDWDQSGKDENGTNFDNNMDNIFNLGLRTSFIDKTSSNFYIEGSIEEVKTENMFIGFNTTVTF